MIKAALLLLILAISLIGTVATRDPLWRGIAHIVTVRCLHTISWRRSMLVLDGLDWLLFWTVLVICFDLAGSLASADIRLLLELIGLIIIICIIITNLRQYRVAGRYTPVKFGLVLALTDLRVALDLRLPVLIRLRLSLAYLLLSLCRDDLFLDRH